MKRRPFRAWTKGCGEKDEFDSSSSPAGLRRRLGGNRSKKLTLNNTEKLDLHNHLRKKVQPKIDPNMKLGKPIEISPWRSMGVVQAHG